MLDLARPPRASTRVLEVVPDGVTNTDGELGRDLDVAVRVMGLEHVVLQRTRELAAQKAALEQTVAELRATQGMLLQAQKLDAIGQLAGGIAHEINTPMQSSGDNARFLEKAFAELLLILDAADLSHLDAPRARRLALVRERVPRARANTCAGVDSVSKVDGPRHRVHVRRGAPAARARGARRRPALRRRACGVRPAPTKLQSPEGAHPMPGGG
jgi:signal transduction histidine kinase